ncbi:dimethyladenosine transferase 2, mitochondrial isoform X2 [Adelges cooleyi]|uniref:dimethyladenosine transferase 2, mitochondrial isoform X2 n=1 Tax=Adelges cooleyi TaxID=133065 RepID=UPI00217FB0F9|nr:dimethyladenosine transferase 2, mitochondrial isoform X2 [Adelges cooleyi]
MIFFKNVSWFTQTSILKWTCGKRSCSISSSLKTDLLNNDEGGKSTLYKCRKYPETMFVHCPDVADAARIICSNLTKSSNGEQLRLIEANPGPCLISHEILKNTNHDMCIYENDSEIFKAFLLELISKYDDRISLNRGNLLLLWKIEFLDRVDRGNRVSKFLSDIRLPSQPWQSENIGTRIIAGLPNRKFLNYLIYSFVFQTSLMTYGRPEFYFFLPPSLFIRYSSDPVTGEKYYKTQTILFQSFFEIELLKTYPRSAFLPPKPTKSSSKKSRFKELKEVDEKSIILARVVGRSDILGKTGLTEELLKPYWYFVKHHTLSRKNFVIPLMEQWIPGCGPHFIAQGLTIFTQFGDLTPNQILKIFLTFVKLPEYKDSPFLNSMEMRIAKLDPSSLSMSENTISDHSENKISSTEVEDLIDKD